MLDRVELVRYAINYIGVRVLEALSAPAKFRLSALLKQWSELRFVGVPHKENG